MTVPFGANMQGAGGQTNIRQFVNNAKPAVVVLINLPDAWICDAVHSYGGKVIARTWFDGSDQWPRVAANPEAAADYAWGKIGEMYGGIWAKLDGFVGFNEWFGRDKFQNEYDGGGGEIRPFWSDYLVWKQEGEASGLDGQELERIYWWNRDRAWYIMRHEVAMMKFQDWFKAMPLGYGCRSDPSGNPEPWQQTMLCQASRQLCGRNIPGDWWSAHSFYWPTAEGPLARVAYDPAGLPGLMVRELCYAERVDCAHGVGYTEGGCDNRAGRGYRFVYQGSQVEERYAAHWKQALDMAARLAEEKRTTIQFAAAFLATANKDWEDKGFGIPNSGPVPALMQGWPKQPTVYEQEVTPVDQRELWLRDIWKRQGVTWDPDNNFCKYALKMMLEEWRVIYPLPAPPPGHWMNYDHPKYIFAYTIPPMYADKATLEVKEGIPLP